VVNDKFWTLWDGEIAIYPVMALCDSRKYLYSPHRRDWNFLGGVGFYETKTFKEMYEA